MFGQNLVKVYSSLHAHPATRANCVLRSQPGARQAVLWRGGREEAAPLAASPDPLPATESPVAAVLAVAGTDLDDSDSDSADEGQNAHRNRQIQSDTSQGQCDE